MISKINVEAIDAWLDKNVSSPYTSMSLAQDWARVAKISEEAGEAIAELILLTGQNPRKGTHPEAYRRLLMELADTALTAIYAIQHFTKNIDETEIILIDAQVKCKGYAGLI